MHYNTSKQERFNLGFCGHTCNTGMHFAGLYETDEERDEILLGYLRQGILDDNVNLYAAAEQTKEQFYNKFRVNYPDDYTALTESEKTSIMTPRELYYPDGEFSPWQMDKNLESFWQKSQENEKNTVRATAEMVWALEINLDRTKLMAYESRLNYFIPGKSWVTICMYNISKFSGAAIMQVLQTHPYTIGKDGVITKNPYFVDPDIWLQENAPEYMNRD